MFSTTFYHYCTLQKQEEEIDLFKFSVNFDFFNDWPKLTKNVIKHLDHKITNKRTIYKLEKEKKEMEKLK
jgi:hypothetical protein